MLAGGEGQVYEEVGGDGGGVAVVGGREVNGPTYNNGSWRGWREKLSTQGK